jgi:hypothetical protein
VQVGISKRSCLHSSIFICLVEANHWRMGVTVVVIAASPRRRQCGDALLYSSPFGVMIQMENMISASI